MLSRNQRLNLTTSFKWVASGKRSEGASGKIFFREGENVHPLIGVSVSSKVFPTAIQRNRAKRLWMTACQNLYPQLSPSLNIVIMPKSSTLDQSSDQLTEELKSLLKI